MQRLFLFLFILQMVCWSAAPAQEGQSSINLKVPLEQLLNCDGTLNLESEFHGSVDPGGWQMTTGPNGEPRFVPANTTQQTPGGTQLMAVTSDENWDDRFFMVAVGRLWETA